MKRILENCVITLIGSVVLTVSAYGIQNLVHTATQRDVRIVYKGEETAFELPVVDVEGKIYISLREMAEKEESIVFWTGQECFVFTNPLALLENFLGIDAPSGFVLETMDYSISPRLVDGCNYGDSVTLYASGTLDQTDMETCVANLRPCTETDSDFTALISKINQVKQPNKLSEKELQYYMGRDRSDTCQQETYLIFEKLENGKVAFYCSCRYN